MLTDEMKAAGWIEHDGGPCPLTGEGEFVIAWRGGGEGLTFAGDMPPVCWEHSQDDADIVAYRPYKPENSRD